MGVSSQTEPDDVLESLLQSSETNTKLMLAVEGSIVTHHDSKTTFSFNLSELLFEPSKLMAWIVSFTPDVEVECVATVGVVGDEAGASGQSLAIFERRDIL